MAPLWHQAQTATPKDRRKLLKILIGASGFEPPTSCSRRIRSISQEVFESVVFILITPCLTTSWSNR